MNFSYHFEYKGKFEYFTMYTNNKKYITFYFQVYLDETQQNEKLMTHTQYYKT